jgi:hypothetical protein
MPRSQYLPATATGPQPPFPLPPESTCANSPSIYLRPIGLSAARDQGFTEVV